MPCVDSDTFSGHLIVGSRVCVRSGRQFHDFEAGDLGVVVRLNEEPGSCVVIFDKHPQEPLPVAPRHLELVAEKLETGASTIRPAFRHMSPSLSSTTRTAPSPTRSIRDASPALPTVAWKSSDLTLDGASMRDAQLIAALKRDVEASTTINSRVTKGGFFSSASIDVADSANRNDAKVFPDELWAACRSEAGLETPPSDGQCNNVSRMGITSEHYSGSSVIPSAIGSNTGHDALSEAMEARAFAVASAIAAYAVEVASLRKILAELRDLVLRETEQRVSAIKRLDERFEIMRSTRGADKKALERLEMSTKERCDALEDVIRGLGLKITALSPKTGVLARCSPEKHMRAPSAADRSVDLMRELHETQRSHAEIIGEHAHRLASVEASLSCNAIQTMAGAGLEQRIMALREELLRKASEQLDRLREEFQSDIAKIRTERCDTSPALTCKYASEALRLDDAPSRAVEQQSDTKSNVESFASPKLLAAAFEVRRDGFGLGSERHLPVVSSAFMSRSSPSPNLRCISGEEPLHMQALGSPAGLSPPSPRQVLSSTSTMGSRSDAGQVSQSIARAEVLPRATICACGNVFMVDSEFCRKCGVWRPHSCGSHASVVWDPKSPQISVQSV